MDAYDTFFLRSFSKRTFEFEMRKADWWRDQIYSFESLNFNLKGRWIIYLIDFDIFGYTSPAVMQFWKMYNIWRSAKVWWYA